MAPTQVCFGDKDRVNAEPMLWYGGRIDDSAALSPSAVKASLESLGMIYEKTIPVPPGTEEQ